MDNNVIAVKGRLSHPLNCIINKLKSIIEAIGSYGEREGISEYY